MTSRTISSNSGGGSIASVSALVAVFGVLALIIAGRTIDHAMGIQAMTFIVLVTAFLVGTGMWAGNLINRNPFDESRYEDTLVKFGVFASVFWGIAGLLVGVIIALQLTFVPILPDELAPPHDTDTAQIIGFPMRQLG